jgi:hypothetical protein
MEKLVCKASSFREVDRLALLTQQGSSEEEYEGE